MSRVIFSNLLTVLLHSNPLARYVVLDMQLLRWLLLLGGSRLALATDRILHHLRLLRGGVFFYRAQLFKLLHLALRNDKAFAKRVVVERALRAPRNDRVDTIVLKTTLPLLLL